MNKPLPKPYATLISEELSEEQIKQLDHNLIRFVELLIKLDKQQKQSKETSQL